MKHVYNKEVIIPFEMPVLVESDDVATAICSTLSSFFKKLGWNPASQTLDPRKVVISENNYTKIVDLLKTLGEEHHEMISTFCLNYMPRAEAIADDIVIIHNDAIKEY